MNSKSASRNLLLLTLLAGCAALAPAAEQPPNIVFILTDDTGYGDLSAHGNPILRTPRLDALRAESVRFTDFHVSPTCAPTRAALLTGRHEFKNGVTHTIFERERLAPGAITLPQVLQRAGYTTGIFGKWHLGDEAEYRPDRRGFHETFIHGGGGIGQTYPGSCGDAPGNLYTDPAILHNGTFVKTTGFCTDVFTDQALRWIESVKERPFYCHLAFNAAHEPVSCPPEYEAPYKGKVPEKVATFYGMIANIDANVGKILDRLAALDLTRQTIVIYMNDNGEYGAAAKVFNAEMRGAKGSPWLGGTRAVSLWRWPGKWPPHDVAALTAHLDFFPTLAELAQAAPDGKVRAQVEGRSLVPLLLDATAPWPERTLFTHVGRWPIGAPIDEYKYSAISIRRGPWHLVSDGNPNKPKAKAWQLFDMKTDPGEQRDVASEHPEVVQKLDTAYDEFWKSAKPLMVNETVRPPEMNPFKELYWKQYGLTPTLAELDEMKPKPSLRKP